MNVHKETLKKALNAASFPVLAALLVHFTKDISILDKLPKPKQAVLGETQGFLTPQEKEKIKKIALNEIESFYLNSTLDDVYIPSNEEMHKMMNFIVGENVQKDYIPMMLKELNLNGHDLNQQPAKVKSSMEVLIIGAGMSGILAAIKLAEAGIKYKIYEKNNNLGGTWYENKYPGSRVDIANHFYSYSFEENYQWSEHFSQQPELLEYFKKCFYKYDIQNHTYFGTQVTDMQFDNSSHMWELHSLFNGKKTKENEREFRSFFDKIIQVPFTMPTGAYNIMEFLKQKLKELDIVISDNNFPHLNKIVTLTVGNNPRSLKRYLNSFSLIAILIESDDDNDDEHDEIDFILLFAVLGLQISYQDIFRLLLIDHNYIEWEKLFAAKIDLDLEKTEQDISKIGDSEYTNEIWEKIIWGICQNDTYLKNQTFKILELLNILRDIVPNQLNEKLDKALDFASITNVDDNIAIKPVTTKGQVTYFGGFDNYISLMRTGQEENQELGLKRRAPKKISNESELFLRKWVAYFESVNCELKFTPSAGCSVQYEKRKIGQLKPPDRKGLIEFLILRSSKRGYKKPAIKGVNVSNIIKYAPDDGPSYVLPWGKELFKVLETQELIDLHENHLKTFIEEAIETVDGNNVLKVTRENHNILKEIFETSDLKEFRISKIKFPHQKTICELMTIINEHIGKNLVALKLAHMVLPEVQNLVECLERC